ncbi:hypothetical protein [Streptosporangium lutulentum]|uniref:Uncharacterized protein n=1 Tax=Streptosporangium lutulentum TaxID=1461250 RepID=A0ABT9QA52_9ACTN|nr:hypothetical protein [Streptosporangium lutulentum]MDP9843261.1 hypothetical protein [Streptosporangium lutulentum]
MAENEEPVHPRFTETITVVGRTASTYSSKAANKDDVRRASLRDRAGQVLGNVWTDGQEAAGFVPSENAGMAGITAQSRLWGILRNAYASGRPARDVLDPALYAPEFELVVD